MTRFADKKREQDKARRAKELPEQVKLLEGRINALEMALAEHASRLDALEVVKVPSPTTTEPELLFEDQRPETE